MERDDNTSEMRRAAALAAARRYGGRGPGCELCAHD